MSSTLRHKAAAAETLAELDASAKPAVLERLLAVLSVPPAGCNGGSVTAVLPAHADAIELHRQLSRRTGILADAEAASELAARCSVLFPCSSYFGGAQATAREELTQQLVDRVGGLSLTST